VAASAALLLEFQLPLYDVSGNLAPHPCGDQVGILGNMAMGGAAQKPAFRWNLERVQCGCGPASLPPF